MGNTAPVKRISNTDVRCHWLCLRWTMASLQALCDRTGMSMLMASWEGTCFQSGSNSLVQQIILGQHHSASRL